MADNIYRDVVEFVKLATEHIDALEGRPSFDEKELEKTAGALIGAGLLHKSEVGQLSDLFKADPNKALQCLQKVASDFRQVGDYSLGAPAFDGRAVTKQRRKSDEALFRALGI